MNVNFDNDTIQKIAKKSDYYNWLINYNTYDYSKFPIQWLTKCPYYILLKLHTVRPLKEKVADELKNNFNADVARIFITYLNE